MRIHSHVSQLSYIKYHAANTIPPTKLANCCKTGEDVNNPGDELVLAVAAGAAEVFADADNVAGPAAELVGIEAVADEG